MNWQGRMWMWVSIGLVLIVGMGLGVILDRALINPGAISADVRGSHRHDHSEHADRSRQFLDRLHVDLDLSDRQKEQIAESLALNHERAREFWTQAREEFTELRQEFRADIRAVLDPQQGERFDEIIREYEERRRSRRDR